jgi:hypothetical protein
MVCTDSKWTARLVNGMRGVRADPRAEEETLTLPRTLMRSDEHNPIVGNSNGKWVYWHRELPPLEAEMLGEHVVEAMSSRVPSSIAHGGKRWDGAYHELLENAQTRMKQEIARLAGRYAHVLDESIDSRRDEATGEAWLHALFTYELYR